MTSIPRFTPGRFTALWVVLRSLNRLGEGIRDDELLTFARRSGLRAGGLPVADGLTLAIQGDFIEVTDGRVHLTSLGKEALARVDDDEPAPEVLRLFSSVLFLRHPPTWVAYWQGNQDHIDLAMPEGNRDVLRAAGLLDASNVEDIESWALWNALRAVPPLEAAMAHRATIGAAGEELAVAYERSRLASEGFPELARRVRWVARESAAYGFDVLSYGGRTFSAARPATPLAIEVKASANVTRENVGLFLTRHEWETSRRFPGLYLVQHWSGVRPGRPPESAGGPLIIRADLFIRHVPSPVACQGTCRWESAWLEIPRAEFEAK